MRWKPACLPSPQPAYNQRLPDKGGTVADLSTTFTGIRFENPFMLASAPPTESDANIMRAFDAGWGGVVTKTIGMHPVVNVKGPKTKFLRTDGDGRLSMAKRPDSTLIASWNWEVISDKPIDWWIGRLKKIKQAFPKNIRSEERRVGKECRSR